MLRPLYYFNMLVSIAGASVIIPYGRSKLENSYLPKGEMKSEGLGDIMFQFGYFFINDVQNKFWVGASQYLIVPSGKYSKSSPVNFGENRFVSKTELGIVKVIDKWMFEFDTYLDFYGENKDYLSLTNYLYSLGTQKLKQKPVLDLEVQATYSVVDATNLTFGFAYLTGGETKINSVSQDDSQKTFSAQASFSQWLAKGHNLTLLYVKDLDVENGYKANAASLRYMYLF